MLGGGGWHKALVFDCLPLAAPIGLSPLLILTLYGPERAGRGGGVGDGLLGGSGMTVLSVPAWQHSVALPYLV